MFESVHAFEPSGPAYSLLEINSRMHGGIIPVRAGLSNRAGAASLGRASDGLNLGEASIASATDVLALTEAIVVMRLDDYISSPCVRMLKELGYTGFFVLKKPHRAASKFAWAIMGLLTGEEISFKPRHEFEKGFYPMIVALKTGKAAE